eukprot:scaffold956_cov97-Cylindrotheca_fusiformis.AAC.1
MVDSERSSKMVHHHQASSFSSSSKEQVPSEQAEMQEKIAEMEHVLDTTTETSPEDVEVVAGVNDKNENEEASKAAKKETDKLKAIMKTTMKTTKKGLKGAGKSIKKNVKALKQASKKKMNKCNKSGIPIEVSTTPKDLKDHSNNTNHEEEDGQELDPANKVDTDSESGEKEEEIKILQTKVELLQEDNLELRGQIKNLKAAAAAAASSSILFSEHHDEPFDEKMSDTERTMLARKAYEEMTYKEKVVSLEAQVNKWQMLYLESNKKKDKEEEEGDDEGTATTATGGGGGADTTSVAKSAATAEEKKDEEEQPPKQQDEDRILMLEYQLRESVKVLKTAQKKMVAQHEKEFHLQKTVDDLSDQILQLSTKLDHTKEANEDLKHQLEGIQQQKADLEAELATERQVLDDFREDLGLEPMYKNQQLVVAEHEDALDDQIQSENSSCFCFGQKAISQ